MFLSAMSMKLLLSVQPVENLCLLQDLIVSEWKVYAQHLGRTELFPSVTVKSANLEDKPTKF